MKFKSLKHAKWAVRALVMALLVNASAGLVCVVVYAGLGLWWFVLLGGIGYVLAGASLAVWAEEALLRDAIRHITPEEPAP